MAKLLILVDGSSYLYRAFHALPSLTTSGGQHTGAIHGVGAMLRRLIKDYKPDYFAVVFDAPGKTFRDDIYPEYKANRPPMPDELRSQIEPLHDLVKALGLPLLSIPGVEADDVIGTLAKAASDQNIETVISTGDKDMAQLVDEHVRLVNTMDNTELDSAGVEQKFGVRPDQIIDYLTLIGDSVDNVPGVPKVGPKTAAKWLQQYGNVDQVVAHADKIGGKIGENLRASLGQLPLSRRLVTIDRDVELERNLDDLAPEAPDRDALIELLKRLEFKTWLNEVLGDVDAADASSKTVAEHDYHTILDRERFEAWLKRLRQAELIAVDTETNALDYTRAEVVGVSFSVTVGEAAYVPFAHQYPGAPEQLTREEVLSALKPILESARPAKTGHNLKYDCNVLANHDIALGGIEFDSMLESYVLDSTATRHDMDSLALKYLGRRTIHYEDVAGKGAQQISFDQVPLEQAGPYAAEDADIALALHETLYPRLQQEPGLRALYLNIEIPLLSVLSRMERAGVKVDTDMLAVQSKELAERMAELEEQAFKEAGQRFNIASPKQIQGILYERLELPVLAKTPKGQPSTAESVLQELALEYPLPKLILDHRALSKLKSTYTDKLPKMVSTRSGRVHTSYHQAVAATGRLSSSDPNLQNIPVRSAEGRRIRQAFVAPAGCRLIAADYSQIELRIMAHLSGDEGLLAAFAEGEDIHKATAAEVFGIDRHKVDADQRRAAKAINFGLIYGMSAFGLAKQLGIDRSAAQQYVERYFHRYPGVRAFMDEIRATAKEQGFVETVFKRRLYLPEINSGNAQRRQYAERTAINAPMQGTAADIIKRAMIAVDKHLLATKSASRLIMQVHDELVLEAPEGEVASVCDAVQTMMSGAAVLRVPLEVDIGVGANWDEAH
jgi:DNA polymerase-1